MTSATHFLTACTAKLLPHASWTVWLGIACWLIGAVLARPASGEEGSTKPWQAYFQQHVDAIHQTTQDELAAVTRENWQQTAQAWREELREMLGLSPSPEKTDLQATTTGSIHLREIRIDRLHYQSRPGLYVGANLYLPTGPSPDEGWPAVLYVCGHARVADHGRQLGNKTNYQHHGLWLARHGVACLMIDTVQLGEFHGEHHGTYKLGRWDWLSRGFTPAGVETWNALRGIDLLAEHPDVNANKLGITGRSGGGAYSWFAAALDERIRVAVPVAGITDLQNHVIDGCVEGHCDCMYFANYHRWDYGKLAALVAPRALLLANSDTDEIFPLDGVMRIDGLLRRHYAHLQAADQYGLVITPGPHRDTQELQVPAFRWLLKHLTDAEPVIDSAAHKEVDPAHLAVFERETPKDERVTSVAGWFAPATVAVSDPTSAASLWPSRWMPELSRLGAVPDAIASVPFHQIGSGSSESGSWKLFSSAPDPAGPIQILRVEPVRVQAAPVASLILADHQPWEPSKVAQRIGAAPLQSRLAAFPGRVHYFIRWRGADWISGESNVKRRSQIVRRFYLLGQSPEQAALGDYLTALHWLTSQSGDKDPIELVAAGRESLVVALGGLLSQSGLRSTEGSPLAKIRKLHLASFPTDPSLSSCLPGLLRVCPPESLLAAAKSLLDVEPCDVDSLSGRLLVDTVDQPQQANGMRIVEVSSTAASVWLRATRWPLANLGGLPEVTFQVRDGKHSYGTKLPETGVDGLRFGVPGVAAEVRVGHRARRGGTWRYSPWEAVTADSDYSNLVRLESLEPGTEYEVRTQVRSPSNPGAPSSLSGSFRTLPDSTSQPGFRLAVGTCQAFPDRDGPHGFDLYRTMLKRGTDAFVMAGDVVYYDRLARSPQLAYYHWQRTYSLPTLIEFHKRVPTFFLKDDHDTYVNDSWPGTHFGWTEEFTFEQGQQIFRQETGLPAPAYRTFQVGRDLQVWLMEGRDYRSPNPVKDGPEKTIWGPEQKRWLKQTLAESKAKFKVILSPTPIVGPDRDNKRDNHANSVFATEGDEVRRLLAASPNTVSVCGDRHWQFHSIDPETGLHEFSVGPASDRHAGGWKAKDFRPEIHQFLRVGGGYLELELEVEDGRSRLFLRHLDTAGKEQHRHVLD